MIDLNRLRQQYLFDSYGGMPELSYDQTTSPSRGPLMQQMPPQQLPIEENPFYARSQVESIANRLGGQNLPSPGSNQSYQDPQSIFDAINKVYTPETTARDRFGNLLDSYPERNTPGWGRKLTASMVALGDPSKGGGIAGAENVMYAPYMRDVQAWKEKAGPFQQAASLENTANNTERALAGNVVTGLSAQTRAEQQAEAARQREETARLGQQNTLRIAQIREAVQRGGVKEVITDSENIQIVMNDGRMIDTGVKTTSVNPLELENIKAQHAQTLKQTPPGVNPLSVRPQSGRDLDLQEQRTLRTLFSTSQAGQNWIKQNDDGSFALAPEPTDPVQHKEWETVARQVYPGSFQPAQPSGPSMGGQAPPIQGTPGVNMTPLPSGMQTPKAMQPGGNKQQFQPTPQQQEGLRNRSLLRIMNPLTGEEGVIPNNYRSIEEAKGMGWNIQVGG